MESYTNMIRPSISELSRQVENSDSVFTLVIGVATRAREIADELCQNGETLEEKPVKTAIRELAEKKYRIVAEPFHEER